MVISVLGSCLALIPLGLEDPAPWRIESFVLPEEVVLEVGGIAVLGQDRLLVCTRRGEVWVVQGQPAEAKFTLFADGLQEPLGLYQRDGWIYTAQRGELSRMRDVDGDDRMDELETVCDGWEISGNYHEYNFGPRWGPDQRLWITTNKPFGEQPFGQVDWRGFALSIDIVDGSWKPMCAGLRSPAGIQASPWGDLFYTDNQGEWCGASKLSRLEPGSFHGHPWGRESCELDEWTFDVPPQPVDGVPMPEVAQSSPSFRLPAVWFPYDKPGRSPSGFAWDTSGGAFGPFEGQVFVGDQYAALVMRVFLEQVDGLWQGACFPFLDGLASGVTRIAFDPSGRLVVGMTDRGWPALGRESYGLERIVWNGETPFEVRTARATPTGFALEFTRAVDPESAQDPDSFRVSSYTYLLHSTYGSDETDTAELEIASVRLSEDARTVELELPGRREGYVHEIHLEGVRDAEGAAARHTELYYTLVRIPH